MLPVSSAEEVADRILRCARDPRREVNEGRAGQVIETLHALAPGLYGRTLPYVFERAVFTSAAIEMGPGPCTRAHPRTESCRRRMGRDEHYGPAGRSRGQRGPRRGGGRRLRFTEEGSMNVEQLVRQLREGSADDSSGERRIPPTRPATFSNRKAPR